jgi:hypothetical protein
MQSHEAIIDIESRKLKSSPNIFGEEIKDSETGGTCNTYERDV